MKTSKYRHFLIDFITYRSFALFFTSLYDADSLFFSYKNK